MGVTSQKFQAPKGTRDFYPADLVVRRHIENVWRETSINHGFDEIDGPTFEHLDLYTHKSGPGIVSELFQVMSGKDAEQLAAIRAGESAPYALRPEFTPTLARMVAARAPELPRPIKWFAIPSHFRAESPQRGRLREFMQWNVDFIGDSDAMQGEMEIILVLIESLRAMGFGPHDVTIRYSDRQIVTLILEREGVNESKHAEAFQLLDKARKIDATTFRKEVEGLKLPQAVMEVLRSNAHDPNSLPDDFHDAAQRVGASAAPLFRFRDAFGEDSRWLQPDLTIARGLDYYTGVVFEVYETTGAERAIAGGGRYDNLIESFGGPKLPACGFGMGDVVLANILKDKGLLKPADEYLPRPDAFVIAANDDAAAKLTAIVADLRKNGGLHVRHSYKTTRNVGKLLGEAGKVRARFAIILGNELAAQPPQVVLKNLDTGEQREVPVSDLSAVLRAAEVHA